VTTWKQSPLLVAGRKRKRGSSMPLTDATASIPYERSARRGAFAAANPRVADGQRLLNTPPHNWRLDANYEHPIGSWTLFANASVSETGKMRLADPIVNVIKSYELYRASIGVRIDRYEVRLFGENLSDERGPTAANGPTLLAGPRPLTVGVGFRVNWD